MGHEALVLLNVLRATLHNNNVHVVGHDSCAREVKLLCVDLHFELVLGVAKTRNTEQRNVDRVGCLLLQFSVHTTRQAWE